MGSARVIRVEEPHSHLLAEFYRATWDADATSHGVAAARRADARRNVADPGTALPTYLFVTDGKPVGHLTTLPVVLTRSGRTEPAYFLKGFWVLLEHRNGPVGFLLAKAALRDLGTVLSLTVESAPRRLLGALGMVELGPLRDYIRVFNFGNVLRALRLRKTGRKGRALQALGIPIVGHVAGAILGGATRLWRGLHSTESKVACRVVGEPDATALDELWAAVSRDDSTAPVRDGGYLECRVAAERQSYAHVEARTSGQLAGYALLRRPSGRESEQYGPLRIACLSDVIYDKTEPAVARALVAGAEDVVRGDCDLLVCGSTDPRLHRLLAERAFLPAGRRVYLLARGAERGLELPDDLSAWSITRGDGGADGGF